MGERYNSSLISSTRELEDLAVTGAPEPGQILRAELLAQQALGGVGLFLVGMKVMSDALMELAGNRLRRILASLTSNRSVMRSR